MFTLAESDVWIPVQRGLYTMKRGKEPKIAVFQNPELETKVDVVMQGFQPHYRNKLLAMPLFQAGVIVDYVLAMKTEFNPRPSTVKNPLTFLMHLSKFRKYKTFREMTREDVLAYLDAIHKEKYVPEDSPIADIFYRYNANSCVWKR